MHGMRLSSPELNAEQRICALTSICLYNSLLRRNLNTGGSEGG